MSEKQTSLQSTLFAEASPARTSVSQGSAPDSQESDPVSGANTHASSKSSAPGSSSSKTLRRLLVAGWTALSVTSSGVVTGSSLASSKQATSELRTDESDSSSWPTPMARDMKGGFKNHTRGGRDLSSAVRDWPTATATDAKDSARHGYMIDGHSGTTLLDAVRQWPTPRAEDSESSGAHRGVPDTLTSAAREYPTPSASSYGTSNNGCPGDGREEYATKGKPSLDTMAHAWGGKLNPDWVETLMGFPIGWTDGPLDPATLLLFGSLAEL
jgi:hypothetical protein